MREINILWIDDEISFLKSHIIFLEQKNYKVTPCQSGKEAIEVFKLQNFDIVFLDENMPGISGLDTLSELKTIKSNIPVVMITKSEEEYISKVIELSNNKNEYLNLREHIFKDALKTPLFNQEKFSKNFYQTLEQIIN